MIRISDTGLSPSMDRLPRLFSYPILPWWLSEPRNARIPVWALSLSLAATKEIDFSFSSSPYLDVSVQEVPSVHLFYSVHSDWGLLSRVSPFRNLRVNGYLLLTVAYRSLSRLSSALSAKASTLRSFLLNLTHETEQSVSSRILTRWTFSLLSLLT